MILLTGDASATFETLLATAKGLSSLCSGDDNAHQHRPACGERSDATCPPAVGSLRREDRSEAQERSGVRIVGLSVGAGEWCVMVFVASAGFRKKGGGRRGGGGGRSWSCDDPRVVLAPGQEIIKWVCGNRPGDEEVS